MQQRDSWHKKRPINEPWERVTLGELRDERKFEDFVHQSYGRLLSFAYQILGDWEDAKDVVQTVFVELWEIVTKRLREPKAKAITVAYILIKRRALDIIDIKEKSLTSVPKPESSEASLNGEFLNGEVELLNFEGFEECDIDVERLAIAVEKREAMHKIGKQLQGRAKEVFDLFMRDFSNQEIADELGVTPSRVSQLFRTICAQFKQKLQEMGYDCNETIGVPLRF